MLRIVRCKCQPGQRQEHGETSRDEESGGPVNAIDQRTEHRMNHGIGEDRCAGDEPVGERLLAGRKPVSRRPRRSRVQRGAHQAHQRSHPKQGQPHLAGSQDSEADSSSERAEKRGAKPHARQGDSRPPTIDQPPAGNHKQRVNHEERRVDDTHPFRRDAELLHDAFITRARDARAVEVTDEAKRHQERQDHPATTGRLHEFPPDSVKTCRSRTLAAFAARSLPGRTWQIIWMMFMGAADWRQAPRMPVTGAGLPRRTARAELPIDNGRAKWKAK